MDEGEVERTKEAPRMLRNAGGKKQSAKAGARWGKKEKVNTFITLL